MIITLKFLENLSSKELHEVLQDKFLTLSATTSYAVSLFNKVVASLPEKVKEIAKGVAADKTELSGDDICQVIREAKEVKDKGSITEPQFKDTKGVLKKQLRAWLPQGYYPGGVREKGAAILPTGLAMLDLDNLKMSPREMYVQVKDTLTKLSLWHLVALAHMTPSCEGLRLVFVIPYGMQTPEEAQGWLATVLDVDCDRSCKDLARLSFVVPESYYFHHDLNLLFADHTDHEKRPRVPYLSDTLKFLGRKPAPQAAVQPQPVVSSPAPAQEPSATPTAVPTQSAPVYAESESADALYRKVIDEWLRIELNGRQAPVKGERNTVVNKLGADLRKYFRLSLDKMMQLIDGWGLTDSEKRSALESGMSYEADPYSETMRQAVNAARGEADCLSTLGHIFPIYADTPPQMPAKLPRLMEILTEGYSDTNRPLVATAVFPPLAVHMKNMVFAYHIDESISFYHAAMMHATVGPSSSGKSCVEPVISTIIADIDEADQAGWDANEVWREAKSEVSKNAKQPKRPKTAIRHIAPKTTEAALYSLASNAPGYMFFLSVTELDELDSLTDHKRSELHKMLRDNTDFMAFSAMIRFGADSAMGKEKPNLCINGSTTPIVCNNFFTPELTKGSTPRWTFAFKPEQPIGARVEKSGNTRGLRGRIRPWIENLNACHDTVVAPCIEDVVDDRLEGMPVVECPELGETSQAMYERYLQLASETGDDAINFFKNRAVPEAYLCACTLFVANGMKWEDEIGDFAQWLLDYDMWCKYRLFGSQYNAQKEAERKMMSAPLQLNARQKNALVWAKLPEQVTEQVLSAQYIMAGLTPPKDPKGLLRQWVFKKKLEHTDVPGVYRKLPQTPKKRQVK